MSDVAQSCRLCGSDGPEIDYSRECYNLNACRRRIASERDSLRSRLEQAQEIARRAYRCAQHLAIMHRRENRVMEGAEGELEEIRRAAGGWLTEGKTNDE